MYHAIELTANSCVNINTQTRKYCESKTPKKKKKRINGLKQFVLKNEASAKNGKKNKRAKSTTQTPNANRQQIFSFYLQKNHKS